MSNYGSDYGSPADRLAEYGVPSDAVKELVEGVVQEQLGGFAQRLASHARAVQANPDLQARLPEVQAWLAKDDQVRSNVERLAGFDQGLAVDYAFSKFRESHGGHSRQAPTARSDSPMGSVPLYGGDVERDAKNAYIKARLRQSIRHPDFGDQMPSY